MPEDFPLKAGDTGNVAMLSLCAGGLLRTWTDSGPSRLWSVTDAAYLHSVLGTGTISRTLREEHRFREVGFLSEETGTLWVQSRFPTQSDDDTMQFDGRLIRVEPAGEVRRSVYHDVRSLLTQAIIHARADDEYLLVEKGGWNAPAEPFSLLIVIPDDEDVVGVTETTPEPAGSEIWSPYIAASCDENAGVAPIVIMDAIATWGLEPWDLALTFGTRARS